MDSGSIAGLSFDTLYYIYYDDETLQGGGVTYAAVTTKETALSAGRRFFVGSIRTPADGAAATRGNNDGGATAQTGGVSGPGLPSTETTVGTWSGAGNVKDGDTATGRTHTSGADANPQLTLSGYVRRAPGPVQTIILDVTSEVATNVGLDTIRCRYSTDSGGSWTDIYSTTGTRVKTTDRVVLAGTTDIGKLRVRMEGVSLSDVHNFTLHEGFAMEEF